MARGAQMASFHLAFGVVCVALVSRFVLDERISVSQMLGFGLQAVAIVLITYRGWFPKSSERAHLTVMAGSDPP
jgi:hypothetical protein